MVTVQISQKSTGGLDSYLQVEIAQLAAIYTLRFPGRKIRAILSLADDFMFAPPPSMVEDEVPVKAQNTGPGYLGVMEFGASGADAPVVTIWATIPAPPNPAQWQNLASNWQPARRFSRFFARYAPLLFEIGKYRHEMYARARRQSVHHWRKIFFPRSIPLAPADARGDAPPAILLTMHWLEVGGAETLALDCVHYALRAGLRVFIVADVPALQRQAKRLETLENVTFIRLDRYLAPREWPVYLANLIARENIRAVHNHHCGAFYACLPHLKALFPDLVILDSTHIIEHKDGGFPRISGVWTRFIDIHHVISDELRSFYAKEFQRTDGVCLGRLTKPQDRLPVESRFRLQPHAKRYNISFIGRMGHQKRPFLAAEIMRGLARWGAGQGIIFTFEIMGDGPYRDTMQAILRAAGLFGSTTFHKPGASSAAMLERSDILLLPSANEGLALVCLEAARHGAIPVSTDVGAQRELLPPDLLTDVAPRLCLRQTLGIVRRLITEPGFAATCGSALLTKYQALAAETSAEELLAGTYRRIRETADA